MNKITQEFFASYVRDAALDCLIASDAAIRERYGVPMDGFLFDGKLEEIQAICTDLLIEEIEKTNQDRFDKALKIVMSKEGGYYEHTYEAPLC